MTREKIILKKTTRYLSLDITCFVQEDKCLLCDFLKVRLKYEFRKKKAEKDHSNHKVFKCVIEDRRIENIDHETIYISTCLFCNKFNWEDFHFHKCSKQSQFGEIARDGRSEIASVGWRQ